MSTIDTPFDSALASPAAMDVLRQAAVPMAAVEQYRVLARRLDLAQRAGGPKALLITSPASGEGRTTTAIYTAAALAARGHRVLLADFDLRRPDLAARHDLPPT